MSKPSSGKTKEASGKSKEIKIVTKQVVTLEDVKRDKNKVRLLYVVSLFGEISDKALQYLLSEMKNRGHDVGYEFAVVGGAPASKELSSDLLALKYTGLVETSASKKNAISSLGREFLEKHGDALTSEEREAIKKLVEELRAKVKPIDVEVELRFRMTKPRRPFF